MVAKPIRSEKFLAACSAGLWVLRPEYVADCEKAQKFLDEEPYEWNSRVAQGVDDATADAPSIWRKKLAGKKSVGAFSGWRIALYADEARQPGLLRVLKAGGGQIVASEMEDLEVLNAHNVDFVFADKERLLRSPEIVRVFKRLGVDVLNPEFVADYLIKCQGELPDRRNFLIRL